MKIQNNFSLKANNTFGIDVSTSKFAEVKSIEELLEIIKKEKDFQVLGGGSNILITSFLNRLTLYVNLRGVKILNETENHVFIKAQAGENWHEFVVWCIDNNFGGIENLSLIPGNVGASPIQNIGAYGAELKDVFHKLKAVEIATGKRRIFTKEECNFGYRNSVFKNELKGKYIITAVIYKLTKKNHLLKYSYGAIQSELEKRKISNPSIKDISEVVVSIRNSKLPNPDEIGNGGSFFKNPVVPIDLFENLQKEYPKMPFYKVSETKIKIPAGWLIEQCGFKGKRFGDAGVHEKQALVLVNYGNATGKEIFDLAKKIQITVETTFGIDLEIEVNVI